MGRGSEPWRDSDPVMPVTAHLEMEADKVATVTLVQQSAQQRKQAFRKTPLPTSARVEVAVKALLHPPLGI